MSKDLNLMLTAKLFPYLFTLIFQVNEKCSLSISICIILHYHESISCLKIMDDTLSKLTE